MLTQEQFIRNFRVMANGEVDFFLGSGASIASGIPTGADLIWEFKRSIYCSECGISIEKFKDLALPSTRKLLQEYFNHKKSYPQQYSSNEYSFYFEQCYCDPLARKRFVESLASNREPSIGFLCLAEAISQGKIKNVWTTNFDPLIENAVYQLDPTSNILICSEANRDSIHRLNPQYPVVGKLHGDYRYDWLKNTESELQQLEEKIKDYALEQMIDKQLVVIGYAGNDESIMSFFEHNIDNPSFLSKGLLWTTRKDSYINPRVIKLIQKAAEHGKFSDFVEIESFEHLLYSIYQTQNYHNELIDNRKATLHENNDLHFSGQPVDSFIKLNAYKAEGCPLCNVFETDITSWAKLRKVTSGSNLLVALYSGHIYAFSSAENLKEVFKTHVLSPITIEEVPERIIKHYDSIYIGLVYQLIERTLLSKGTIIFGRHKLYNPASLRIDNGFQVFDAVEIAISFINGFLYLNLLPTVHIRGSKGELLDKEEYKIQVNRAVSKTYNQEYNEKLRYWEKLCYVSGKFVFENDGFVLSFVTPAISLGGSGRNARWPTMPACRYPEPIMCFSDTDKSKQTVNQLKGLCQYGPIDCSYIRGSSMRPSVRLAVLSPKQDMGKILAHLNKLNSAVPNVGKDKFLPNYEGFEKVYHRSLTVPPKQQAAICVGYDGNRVLRMSPKDFLSFMKRGIEYYSQRSLDFDVLIIYIPKYFAPFRTSPVISPDFNLHDALKLYATEKGIKLQLIEERSLNSYDPCKVMWGLSTSLYAKATGILWHPEAIQNDTAYIGISYAYSEEKRICIGCSQLFDSTGTGIRMVLRKINNPIFMGKSNPFMREDDARVMMTELREQYYHSAPVNSLKRIVVHKTTPFIREEISGIMQALRGIDVELVQIQDYCSWRGIQFGTLPSKVAEKFAVKRGLTIKLDNNSFLLWTHGCVAHPEISGALNYYKGSRGIPAPLLVRRYAGNASGDILAQEILMLTKMNWNSGDSLYKTLPVTLDFAKVLARMSKQEEAIFDKAYDFRFFM